MTRSLTHSSNSVSKTDLDSAVQEAKVRIHKQGAVAGYSIDRQMDILEDICSSEFGRFLLVHKGLSGYWTHWVISEGFGQKAKPESIDHYFLYQSYLSLATRERFHIFQKHLQKAVHDSVRMVSVPCGIMADLLTLNFTKINNFKLIGLDLDVDSIEQAKKAAQEIGLSNHTEFYQCDAWDMPFKNEFDVLTSNGLNVYVKEKEKERELYKNFYKVLKPGGTLITSFRTPPVTLNPHSEMDLSSFPKEDLDFSLALYAIVNAQYSNCVTSGEMKSELEKVGFQDIIIEFDRFKAFPTVIAKK